MEQPSVAGHVASQPPASMEDLSLQNFTLARRSLTWLLLLAEVEEHDIVSFNRLHRPASLALEPRTDTACLGIAQLPGCLSLPKRYPDRSPCFSIGENDVTTVTGRAASARMNDVADSSGHIRNSVWCCLQEVHSRKQIDLQ